MTASTLVSHKHVKQLSTYLNWPKIPIGDEEIQLVGLYIEPGDTKVTRERADKAVAIIQDMIRQDRDAHIVVGGDLNAQLNNFHDRLERLGFRPGLMLGTATHRDGNMLDQVWARNLQLTNVMVSEYDDNGISDHLCLKVTVSMPTNTGNRDPKDKQAPHPRQAQIRRLLGSEEGLKHIKANLPDITRLPLLLQLP